MKTVKRISVFILIMSLLLTPSLFLSVSAVPAIYAGSSGDLIWSLNTGTGILTINGSGYMRDYGQSDAPWYTHRAHIKKIVLERGVKNIGEYAFSGCDSLTEVDMGSTVITVDEYAFFNCTSLKSVDFSDSLTSLEQYAFYCCSSLETAELPESLRYIRKGAFYKCTSLSDITLPDGIKEIKSSAFEDTACYNNDANYTDGVLYIGNHIIKAKDDLQGVYEIKEGTLTIAETAFNNCSQLTGISVPDSLTHIGYSCFMFSKNLKSVYITDIQKWASIVFYDTYYDSYLDEYDYGYGSNPMYNSAELYLNGEIVTELDISEFSEISDNAFYNCGSLKRINVGGSIPTIGDKAFEGVELVELNITDIKAWCGFELGASHPLISYTKELYINGERTSSLVIPSDITSISKNTFANCAYLTSVFIPETVTEIGEGAFDNSPVTIRCYENSAAHLYAARNRISFELIEGHSFIDYIYNNDATCLRDGTKTAYCICGCTQTDTVTAENTRIPHSYGEYIYNNDATCTEDGTATASCIYGCGEKDSIIIENTKTGHGYTESVLSNSSCSTAGKLLYLCSCGESYTEDLPLLDHTYGEWTVVSEPDYFNEGRAEKRCGECGDIQAMSIPRKEYTNSFTDIKQSAWYYGAVEYAVKKGYMKGMSEDVFSPSSHITREQFVLILANIAGVNTDEYKSIPSGFEDIDTGKWYSGAVVWAKSEGYVSGVSETGFGRGQSIMRAALARMLFNYASKNGIDISGRAELSGFGDCALFDKTGNAWMTEPVKWAVAAGIISGMEKDGVLCIDPAGTATRAQAAVMLNKFDSFRSN